MIPKYSTVAEACAFVGIDPPDKTKIGGWVRSNALGCGRRGRLDGAVKFWPDGSGGIAVNNRKADSDLTKKAVFVYGLTEAQRLSKKELAEQRRRTEAAIRQQQAAERRDCLTVAAVARQMDRLARSGVHPYLIRKGVADAPGAPLKILSRGDLLRVFSEAELSNGERMSIPEGDSFLFVPLTGTASPLPASAQLITDAAGGSNKRLLKGTRKFTIEGGEACGLLWAPDDLPFSSNDSCLIGLAEGVATALSVRRLYGFPCCAGIDCGNLAKAARTLRKRFPAAHIRLMADRDAHGAGWQGALEALEALSLWRMEPNASAQIVPEPDADMLMRFRCWTGRPDAQITDFNDYEIAGNL